MPFAPALGHVFNHATHHRGQLTAAMTALGQPGPELDWVYLLQQESRRMSTSFTTLAFTVEGAGRTHLARPPEVRNAFNDVVIAELTQAFTEAGAAPQVRVIVLGATRQGLLRRRRPELDAAHGRLHAGAEPAPTPAAGRRCCARSADCPMPIIGRVQGDCYAGGMGLVAVCDMRGRVARAWFCLSEVRLGLLPATISPYVMRAMGERAAQRYFLTAERFGAAEAHRIGFVHEVVAADALDAKVDEIVKALVANGPGRGACLQAAGARRGGPATIDDALRRRHGAGASPTSARATRAAKACSPSCSKREPSLACRLST